MKNRFLVKFIDACSIRLVEVARGAGAWAERPTEAGELDLVLRQPQQSGS